jgi:hypothetical protein
MECNNDFSSFSSMDLDTNVQHLLPNDESSNNFAQNALQHTICGGTEPSPLKRKNKTSTDELRYSEEVLHVSKQIKKMKLPNSSNSEMEVNI